MIIYVFVPYGTSILLPHSLLHTGALSTVLPEQPPPLLVILHLSHSFFICHSSYRPFINLLHVTLCSLGLLILTKNINVYVGSIGFAKP